VTHVVEELQDYNASGAVTSVGVRLEFWKKSLEFARAAPLVGNGTGTIEALFRRSATGDTGTPAVVTGNPHNQILAVAIQLGVLGTIELIAMWLFHVALFREASLFGWFGLIIVVGNIVSSLFNSHLFDLTQGWLYVFGVGVAGGTVLNKRGGAAI
jgi:O-antigen ligase